MVLPKRPSTIKTKQDRIDRCLYAIYWAKEAIKQALEDIDNDISPDIARQDIKSAQERLKSWKEALKIVRTQP